MSEETGETTKDRLRGWLIRLFIQATEKISNEEDRQDIALWLSQSRDVLNSDLSKRDKFTALYSHLDARKTAKVVAHGVVEAVRNYKSSDLPMSLKVAVPVTLLAVPFLGGQGVGVVAFGSAIGLPVLLLVFLGSAGITAVLESLGRSKESTPLIMGVLEIIARDEIARRVSADLKAAMKDEPIKARRLSMPEAEAKLRQRLLTMDPFDFEAHIASFFEAEGVRAWVTKKSNDLGVDGFVDHPDGLVVIQCKRYAPDNLVGGPDVQRFKGAIEDNGAARGYLVTTSGFTTAARASSDKSDRVTLVDIDDLVRWHDVGRAD